MRQANLCKGAWDLELIYELVEIVDQSCLNNTIIGRLKVFDYKKMCSTWIQHNLSPNDDRWKLQVFEIDIIIDNISPKNSSLYCASMHKIWQRQKDILESYNFHFHIFIPLVFLKPCETAK